MEQSRQHVLVLHLGLLLLVTVGYFIVFHIGYGWSESPFYPHGFDQVSYRADAVRVAHGLREGGLRGICSALGDSSTAQGVVLPLVGGLAGLLGLDPIYFPFSLFLISLVVLWIIASSAGREPALGWLVLVLIGSTISLLSDVGGMRDFRPDFLAQTLWTVAAALAIRSRAFSHRGLSIATGIVLGLCFCSRTLTLLHALAAAPLIAIGVWKGHPHSEPGEGRRRWVHLGLTALTATAIALPVFLANFERLREYYLDNHMSAGEITARGFSERGYLARLAWYGSMLFRAHIGKLALLVMAGTLAYALGTRSLREIRGGGWAMLLIGFAFLSPTPVLAMSPHLNSAVAGISAGILVLLAVIPSLMADPARRLSSRHRAILVSLVVLGLCVWPIRYLYGCGKERNERERLGHHRVPILLQAIVDGTAGRGEVVISTIPMMDFASARLLETHATQLGGQGVIRRFREGLGHSIFAVGSRDEYRKQLLSSDVAVWWDGAPTSVVATGGDLPSNRESAANRDLIARLIAEDFYPAEGPARELMIEGYPLKLYFRRR